MESLHHQLNKKEEMKRIDYIDIAKCFAILCVVIGHVLCYDLYGFDHAWKESSLMRFIYSFHMPLFIFLSGLVSVTFIERKFFINDITSVPLKL